MRIDRFVRERIIPAVHRRRAPLVVTGWQVPGEPVPFGVARTQDLEPVIPGQMWGPPWATTWFRITGDVPAGWGGDGVQLEIDVDLGYTGAQPGFQAEATVYRADGTIVKGLHPRNRHVPLQPDQGPVHLWLEAASNPDIADGLSFRPTPLGDPATAGDRPLYRFGGVHVVELDLTVWELLQDVRTLRGLLGQLPADLPRRAKVLRALEDMADAVDPWDVAGTAAAGRSVLADVLARPAHASAHRVVAVGHAHIDSAWLWPTRETARKCARTFSNVLALMDTDPDLVFACSSAQQYAWVRDAYPELFDRIRTRVARDGSCPSAACGWSQTPTCPAGRRWPDSS